MQKSIISDMQIKVRLIAVNFGKTEITLHLKNVIVCFKTMTSWRCFKCVIVQLRLLHNNVTISEEEAVREEKHCRKEEENNTTQTPSQLLLLLLLRSEGASSARCGDIIDEFVRLLPLLPLWS